VRNNSVLQCAGGEEESMGQSHIHCKHQAGKQAGGQACRESGVRLGPAGDAPMRSGPALDQ
jgi:hypothetical protein